jgi:hypothetical protein
MDRPWLRAAQKLQYRNPRSFLISLRRIELELSQSATPDKIKNLRTNGLKQAREQRQAALFCEGMSQRIGQAVCFAAHEDQDFDFIATWIVGSEQHFAPVQLKEVVPKSLNAEAELESVIQGLEKYTNSSGLTVAIHLNRFGRFAPSRLNLQHLHVASVWIFAAAAPDQSIWNLWGNFTEEQPFGSQYAYPTEA